MALLHGLAILLIGWPGIIGAIVFVSYGMYSQRIWLVIIGALLAIPISWYLGSTPKFRYFMYGLPLLFVGSAIAVKLRKNILAWILVIPYVLIMSWVAISVITQGQ